MCVCKTVENQNKKEINKICSSTLKFLLYYYKKKMFSFSFFQFFLFYRSICENCNHAKWQTFEKEEDKYQKMHPQPLL